MEFILFQPAGEVEKALDTLEQMERHIEHYDSYAEGMLGNHIVVPPEKWPTSLLVRPRDENDPALVRSVSSPTTANGAVEFLVKLKEQVFDGIRDTDRFREVEGKLKMHAHE